MLTEHSAAYYQWMPVIPILSWAFAPITTFFCLKSVRVFLVPKKGKLCFLLRLTGAFLLSAMIIYIGDPDNFIPTLLIFSVTACLGYENSRWQKLTIAFITASLGLSISALLSELAPIELWPPLRGFLWMSLFFSIRRCHLEDNFHLSDSLWKLLFFLNLTPLGLVMTVCLGFPLSVDEENNAALIHFFKMTVKPIGYILLLLAILSFYGLLSAIKTLARQYRLEQDQVLYETNRQYYLQLEQTQLEIRKFRHDMVHHLQALTLLSEEERTDYLKDLLDHPSLKYSTGFCQNQTVNAVINAKMSRIREASIDFHCKLSIPQDIPMEKIDLCTIFANCLENAIEACEKFSSIVPFMRTISLESRYDKGIFLLQCKNPLPDSLLTEDGKLVTSKHDRKNHGIGIPNIREAAGRYHGTVETVVMDGKFILLVNIILS